MSSNFTPLSAAIVNVLQGIQQDGAPAFAEIVTYPTTQFAGTPSASIVPSSNTSDYATTVQDLRSYIFEIYLYLDVASDGSGMAVVFPQMLLLVDSVTDALDMSNTLNGTAQIVIPTPSEWALVESADSVLLAATIRVTAKVTTTTNNG
jgi:hypothetical protein